MADLNVRTFCIVTGASRGIGREIAIQLAKKVNPESSFQLIARNEEALKETAEKIRAMVGPHMGIECVSADLSTDEGVAKANREIFENLKDISRFSHAILVHNSAYIGDLTKHARDLDDLKYLQNFNRLNLSSAIVLTSKFFKAFGQDKNSVRKTVVQVTSSAANKSVKTLHTYSMVKAGLEMFFRVMALEEPESRFIIYDPGAVDTKMFREILTSVEGDVVELVANIMKQTYFLTPEQTAGALVKALEENNYENAAVVNAYDVLGMDVPTYSID